MTDTPLYNLAHKALDEMLAYSSVGFPGATLEEVFTMTSKEPEKILAKARLRAERNCELLLAGCWEIWEELDA